MSDLSNEKIIEILKSKGKIEAIKYVKDTLNVDLKEAKELVEDIISKNPGTTVTKPSNTKGVLGVVVFIFLIWAGCNMCDDDKKEVKELTRKERVEKLFSAWDGSQPAVEKWIKGNIKDPDSYKHIETKFIDKTERIGVITTFTATNSFGGRVQTTCLAQIDTLGNLIHAELQE